MVSKLLFFSSHQRDRELYSRLLRSIGLLVVTVDRGDEVLELVEQQQPAVIVVDHLPEVLDGLELARQLRRHPRHAKLPILLLTAELGPDLLLDATQLKVNEVVLKDHRNLMLFLEKLTKYFELSQTVLDKLAKLKDRPRELPTALRPDTPSPGPAAEPADQNRGSQLLRRLDTLPSLRAIPAVVMEIIRLTSASEETQLKRLMSYIERDPAVAARVIHLANSVHFTTSGKTDNLHKAVVALGFERIKEVTLTLSLLESFRLRDDNSSFSRLQFWRHSLSTALFAKLLARAVGLGEHEDRLFLCGLLHDLGVLILREELGQDYGPVFARLSELPLDQLEREYFGLDHLEVGAYLLRRWSFDDTVLDLVANHHPRPRTLRLAPELEAQLAVLVAADTLSGLFRFGFTCQQPLQRATLDLVGRCEVPEKTLVTAAAGIRRHLDELQTAFFHDPPEPYSVAQPLEGRRILLVTSNPKRLNTISLFLRNLGAIVDRTATAESIAAADFGGWDLIAFEAFQPERFRLDLMYVEMLDLKKVLDKDKVLFLVPRDTLERTRTLLQEIKVRIAPFPLLPQDLVKELRRRPPVSKAS
ncbi:MAG: hypothetical protein A2284_12745 [Deltaproteobacteria bacterium RIFOXYA12_FULL_61_11]|nr:MAG: hypothetical protein A2284_12745 [Deltaproteobacteria bacterium RIFOXYA12_FULL_61_11]